MALLIGVGLLAGLATALSPCVLPVLPLVLAGGATGRKPLRIVGGLVLSFSVFLLFTTWLLHKLHLPQDFLRNLAIAFLFVMAAVLLLPPVALLVERGLAFFSRLRPANAGGGFFLGVTLGLVFVPCAGPFLASITAAAAHASFGLRTIVAAAAYGVGAGVPMLAIAYGGRGLAAQLRRHAATIRTASGVVVAAIAIGLVFHVDDSLTKDTLPWTDWVQNHVENSSAARKQERKVSGEGKAITAKTVAGKPLPDLGTAPPLHPDGVWINSKPFTLAQEHGKVVLVDFWTYSCINCLRTLPHLKSWYTAYHKDGFVIVGVHTPEFAFEHVASNVRAAVSRLGVTWPVVQDNNYKTWDNYANEYWPADYLIDKSGHVRFSTFGEGDYGKTENYIRQLLGVNGASARRVANETPTEAITPETYLGYARVQNFVGSQLYPNHLHAYTFPKSLGDDSLAYGGTWKVGAQQITPGPAGAALRLHFHAEDVYIVLGGKGTVQKLIDGKPAGTIHVNAYRLYTVRASHQVADAILELRFSPGVRGYSFTFG